MHAPLSASLSQGCKPFPLMLRVSQPILQADWDVPRNEDDRQQLPCSCVPPRLGSHSAGTGPADLHCAQRPRLRFQLG